MYDKSLTFDKELFSSLYTDRKEFITSIRVYDTKIHQLITIAGPVMYASSRIDAQNYLADKGIHYIKVEGEKVQPDIPYYENDPYAPDTLTPTDKLPTESIPATGSIGVYEDNKYNTIYTATHDSSRPTITYGKYIDGIAYPVETTALQNMPDLTVQELVSWFKEHFQQEKED